VSRRILRAASAVASLSVTAACAAPSRGAHPPTTLATGGSTLTQAQALQLSSVLYRNFQAGGAVVKVEVAYTAGTIVDMVGQIDFRHHEGHLSVTTVTAGTGTSVEDVDYTSTEVYEKGGPVVAQELAAHGHPGQTWVARAPDPTHRPIDKVIQILVALASPTRNNPLLVQESDARYLGMATRDGVATAVYRYNTAITYEVGVGDGILRRFTASVQGFSGPVTVDVTAPGVQALPPPPADRVLIVSRSTSPSTLTNPPPSGGAP